MLLLTRDAQVRLHPGYEVGHHEIFVVACGVGSVIGVPRFIFKGRRDDVGVIVVVDIQHSEFLEPIPPSAVQVNIVNDRQDINESVRDCRGTGRREDPQGCDPRTVLRRRDVIPDNAVRVRRGE